MKLFKFNCGDKVKCRLTGFTGIITARTEWFNGCLRYTVQPRGKKQSEYPDAKCFDEPELVLVTAGAVDNPTLEIKPAVRTGGPAGDRSVKGPTER